MQETWLLINEKAIRHAAGNPNGTTPLNIPQINELEKLSTPKQALHELLKKASGLRGRRLNRFNIHQSAIRIAEFIEDFASLRVLSAFVELETDVKKVISSWR